MENFETTPSANEWVKGKRLGSGTFGLVVLWKNQEKNTTLALKHYKGTPDLKNTERWIKEVAIMKTLKHPNVIRAFDVPVELNDPNSKLPVLAMEYCSGGDLRAVLSKPQSCYGMSQTKVNKIISQVADGIFYLHEQGIIHRDLKPENIVLKPLPEDKVAYKIIDLGYAKDIGHGSIPQSFAGTLQYAAPDLLQKKPYSKTVDYWSLGILTFELINGRRPFSPVDNDPVVGWYNSITGKATNAICMVEDISGNVTFSENLPPNSNLTSNFNIMYQVWLQNMLLLDADKRGQFPSPTKHEFESAPWYSLLRCFFQVQEYRVLDMMSNKVWVYTHRQVKTITDIQLRLAKDAGIPLAEQQLLCPDGNEVLQMNPPDSRGETDAELELPDYFLFRKFETMQTYNINLQLAPLPSMAESIAANPSLHITQGRIRCRSWAECLQVCKVMVDEAVSIQEGIRAMKMNFMRQFKKMTASRHELNKKHRILQGKHEFFKASVSWDLKDYNDQKEYGVNSAKMLSNWLSSEKNFSEMPEDLNTWFRELSSRAEALGRELLNLRAYPLHTEHIDNLDSFKSESEKLYLKLRQDLKGKAPKDVDCSELVEVLHKSRKEREKFGGSAVEQLQTLLASRADAMKIQQEMEELQKKLDIHEQTMLAAQKKRQSEMWMSVRYCMELYAKQKSINEGYEERKQREGQLAASASSTAPAVTEDASGPSTLTTPSYMTAAFTVTSPATLVEPATMIPSVSPGLTSRDFASMSPESLQTIEQSDVVQTNFSLTVDQHHHESTTRLNDFLSLDWDFA